MVAATIVVVEDEENLLVTLRYNLEREGYRVLTASDGPGGLETVRESMPDVVLLDVMLPGMSGYDVCKAIRRDSDVPVLMLTARGEEFDKVLGLELGADDYLTKPFGMRELMARVRALLRRPRAGGRIAESGDAVTSGDLRLDPVGHRAWLAGSELELKPREFDLLALLIRNPGRAYTRDQILFEVWGEDYVGDPRTVDVHVRWLRQKIEIDSSRPSRITTVRGVGYRFEG